MYKWAQKSVAKHHQIVLAAIIVLLMAPASALAQVHHLRELDLSISITQADALAPTTRAYNRLVVHLEQLPFELISLEIGNVPIRICATTTQAPSVTGIVGRPISTIPCFEEGSELDSGPGNMVDGFALATSAGKAHNVFRKDQSVGLGESRITRFSRIDRTIDGSAVDEDVQLTILIDRNENGLVDRDEFSYVDLVLTETAGIGIAVHEPLNDASCRKLLLSEANRIETAFKYMTSRYAVRLGDHFSIDRFIGDTTAVRETKGVFAMLARDQFENMFAQVRAAPRNYRNTATSEQPAQCGSAADVKETTNVAIDTFEQLWEATLELANATVKGWMKVYGKLGQ